ncbi:MAG: quinone-dependent dihydroorotate dehydrogenase [Ahrensia sp.]|nr:quinone-dependent dihydroorotate dehydrogenase [Ahrensia sp.]
MNKPFSMWNLVGRNLSFTLDAETAHGLAIKALKLGAVRTRSVHSDPRLHRKVAGLDFANPIGVAAGFDKNAEVPDELLATGFGFTEVGTITPLAQTGNPKPRIFRLPADEAVINRLGFNNAGHAAAIERLKARRRKNGIIGSIGINIGANKDSADRADDYVRGIKAFYPFADYFTVNISSPNTPGLRDLQARDQLSNLMQLIVDARGAMTTQKQPSIPIFLKIAPDLTDTELDDIIAVVLDKKIDGMIVSNTTIDRSMLSRPSQEAGGLSGKPLFERSTIMLAKTRQRAGKDLALIGVGGVDSAETALTKIQAGADLVQVYTGMIYRGPTIANDINRGLSKLLDSQGASHIGDLRDNAVDEWANKGR